MNYKNYYEILGVPKDAPEKDIKSAYRRLARKWHPDANPDSPAKAEERFKEIQEAYEVLGDAEKRRKFDALGSGDWQRAAQQAEQYRRARQQGAQRGGAGAPGAGMGGPAGMGGQGAPGGPNQAGFDFGAGTGFSDFFDVFFSGMNKGGRGPETQKSNTQDLETTIELSLSEAHEGGKKSVSLQIEELCSRCRGSGIERGRICPQCHGTGRVLATKHFDVNIPAGVREGQRIRLAGQGAANALGQRGDLFLVVHLVGDERFTRKGDDIYLDLQVNIYDLVLGGEVKVPTMAGEVTMTIPQGSQNQRLLRLPGKGMPRVKEGGNGDQYVRLVGMLPTQLSEREYKLFRELAALRTNPSSARN